MAQANMCFVMVAVAAAVACLPVSDAGRRNGNLTRKLNAAENTHLQAICGLNGANGTTYKIEGGDDALPGQFPWAAHVVVHYKNGWGVSCYHTCAATLISRRHALTSAFCYVDQAFTSVPRGVVAHVFYGGVTLANSTKATTTGFRVHEDYIANHFVPERGAELAIVELAQDVPADVATPICTPYSNTLVEPVVDVFSWGAARQSPPGSESRDSPVVSAVERGDVLQTTEASTTARDYDCDGWLAPPRARDIRCLLLNISGEVCHVSASASPFELRVTVKGDAGAGISQLDRLAGRHRLVGVVGWSRASCGRYVGNHQPIAFYFDLRLHVRWICAKTGVCPSFWHQLHPRT